MTYAIRTTDLSRDFGAVRAVDSLTLEIEAGKVFGFLGPNGAGKTTTIRLLLGLLEPTRGGAEVLGMSVATQGDRVRERCGALLEHAGLYERLSAYDNLDFYARIWRLGREERQARIRELLTGMGLWDRRNETVGTWSRGMKQKLAVARTLLHRPALIFLDEPTAGLDPIAASALREDLAGLAEREGVTIFLTTHNLSEAERLCQRIGVIRQGKLLAVGTPDSLRRSAGAPRLEVRGRGFGPGVLTTLRGRPEVESVEVEADRLILTLRGETESAPLIALLVASGAQIEEVRRGSPDLEQAFLTLMNEEQA